LAAKGENPPLITILESLKNPLETTIERLEEEEIRSSESNGLEANRKIFIPTFE